MALPSDLTKDLTRLYISPFTPALLATYLSAEVQQRAQDISYHSLETFPERPFGYVTLPAMDAKKVKTKLSGAILKGSKVRIDEARPAKRKIEEVEGDVVGIYDAEAVKAAAKEKARKEEKRRMKEGVIAGVEIEEGRAVKRGWTEAPEPKSGKNKKESKKDKKEDKKARKVEKVKSRFTSEPELLFKTKVPPNKAVSDAAEDSKKDKKKKKSKNVTRETVVHEFEKTKKHASFLKASATTGVKHDAAKEYVDGKGWINSEGIIVEEAKSSRGSRKKTESNQTTQSKDDTKRKKSYKKDTPSPSPSSSEISSSESSSDSSNSSSEDSDGELTQAKSIKENTLLTPEKEKDDKKPNPLELLFKRKPGEEKRPTPIKTTFDFFPDADDDIDSGPDAPHGQIMSDGPQTPFTQHVESRWVSRSGAPTPDTAAVHRRFSFNRGVVDSDSDVGPFPNQDAMVMDEDEDAVKDVLSPVDEDEDEHDTAITGDMAEGGHVSESAFAKWFWEKRGDNNRTWKRRRKEAMKEKRQRDTRRLGRRIV